LSAFGWHPSEDWRGAAGALAVWSFLGHRLSNSMYRAVRMASLPTQLGPSFQATCFASYISGRGHMWPLSHQKLSFR